MIPRLLLTANNVWRLTGSCRPCAGLAKAWVLALAVTTTSMAALAHAPVARCTLEGPTVECVARYDDGSRADGVAVSVITYGGVTLHSEVLDRQSRFRFDLPTEPFYILMDAGPGETFEVDWRDVQDIASDLFAKAVPGDLGRS